jgi:hypothetical protein
MQKENNYCSLFINGHEINYDHDKENLFEAFNKTEKDYDDFIKINVIDYTCENFHEQTIEIFKKDPSYACLLAAMGLKKSLEDNKKQILNKDLKEILEGIVKGL